MKKSILMLAALLLCQICSAQIRDGNNVIMPIDVYHNYRIIILECDTIKEDANKAEAQCDSIIALQDEQIQDKDSIISNLNSKIELKNEIIEILKKPKNKIHPQLFIGTGIGFLIMALILK